MIKKLIPDHIIGLDGLPTTIMPDSAKLMRKINEIIDAFNNLQTRLNNHELLHIRNEIDTLDDPTYHETPADPYAEQRKWIGKFCRFWDDDGGKFEYGILRKIDEKEIYPFVEDCWLVYKHCEPVKPDDDIIYKGEQ